MSFIFTKRFYPLFVAQFCGAMNDNFLKNAILILVVYRGLLSEQESGGVSNLAAALFILPFFLFSSLAGQLSDKFDRSKCARIVKFIEIPLMLTAAAGFLIPSVPLLLAVLTLMGAQSAFFSPAKYSLIPMLLKEKELLGGNALVEAGTYLAILCGVIGGGLVISLPHGELLCGIFLTVSALAGYLFSRHIPNVAPAVPEMRVDRNFFRQTYRILKDDVFGQKEVMHCVLSSSMFLLAGSLVITQLPLLTKGHLGGDESVCTFFFLVFSFGIGIGAGLSRWMFRACKRFFDARILFAIVLMALLIFDLSRYSMLPPATSLRPLTGMLSSMRFHILTLELLAIAACGGIWSVPLQARMQNASRPEVLARVIAGNNILNSLCMALGGLGAAGLLKCGVSLVWVFSCIALSAAAGGLFLLPFFKPFNRGISK